MIHLDRADPPDSLHTGAVPLWPPPLPPHRGHHRGSQGHLRLQHGHSQHQLHRPLHDHLQIQQHELHSGIEEQEPVRTYSYPMFIMFSGQDYSDDLLCCGSVEQPPEHAPCSLC